MADFSLFISNLFVPSESYSVDSEKRQLQASKNQQIFALLTSHVLVYIILILLGNIQVGILEYKILFYLIQPVLFILLCRSYLKVYAVQYTLLILASQIMWMPKLKELFFFQLGYNFHIPPISYMLTQNLFFTAGISLLQFVIFQTKYQDIIVFHIEGLGPEVFARKLIDATILTFVIHFLSCVLGLILMNEKNLELFQAKKIVEEALEQQKTFILSFTHELRNPLNSLLGNLQLVLMGIMPPETKEMIKTAKICGELLLQYINNLLDTGKFGTGNLEISPASVNVYELFQRIWSISHEIIKRKGLSGVLKIERTIPPQLLLDSQRITQILLNLIGNAVKFTENGSITTTLQWSKYTFICDECFEPTPYDEIDEGIFEKDENVSTMNLSGEKRGLSAEYLSIDNRNNKFNVDEVVPSENEVSGVLKIIVKDTGCGMKKDALQRLFQKFSQVSEDTSKRQIGTGLGLFITKEICKKMGGQIRVYSREKLGTTFIVCIPTKSIQNRRVTYISLVTISRLLSEQRKTAIVADDSPFNVNLLCHYFSKIGVQVIATASNGHDIVKRFIECMERRIRIDVVTLDVDMPKISGKTACEKIRQYEKDYRIPKTNIVMISGNYDESELKNNLQNCQNFDHFLKKPLWFEDFMIAIYELLHKN